MNNTYELRYKATPTELELSDFKNNVIIKELAVPPTVVDAETLDSRRRFFIKSVYCIWRPK